MEAIEAFAIPPWEERIKVARIEPGQAERLQHDDVILVATGASAKNGRVGAGGAIQDTRQARLQDGSTASYYQVAAGPRKRVNIYTAELLAVSMALRVLATYV